VGNRTTLEQLLDKPPKPEDSGPLSEGLKVAAGDHHLVASFSPTPDLVAQARQNAPPNVKGTNDLAEVNSVLVTGNIANTFQLEVQLKFPNEEKAQKAKVALDELVKLAKGLLPLAKQLLAKDPSGKELLPLLDYADQWLQQSPIKQEGATIQARATPETRLLLTAFESVVKQMRGAAESSAAANNLRQLALAMQNYHNAMGRFPVGIRHPQTGQPLLSWRVELLPYLEQRELFKEFHLTEPWDSPHNKALLAKMPKVFEIPERKAAPGRTFFQVFTTAPGLPYAPTNGAPFPDPMLKAPPGQQVPAPRLTSFTDGTSNTILIAEAGDAVEWTRPADIPYRPVGPMPRLGDPTKPGFLVAMADGFVLTVPRTISEKTLRNAISPADGNPLGPDWPRGGAPGPRDRQPPPPAPPGQRDGLPPPPLSKPVERRPPE
jgi:hypothetical protein